MEERLNAGIALDWWWTAPTVDAADDPALIDTNGRIYSRQELADAIRSVSGVLAAQGVARQDRLAVVMAPGPEMAATLLGAMSTAVVAPLASSSPVTVLADSFEALRISGVLVGEHPPAAVIEAADRVGVPVITSNPFRPGIGGRTVAPAPSPDDLALLLQTSGTTARPKIVPLTHANLRASTTSLAGVLDLGATDRGLLVMPLFHTSGIVASLLVPLLTGGSVICCRGTAPADLLDAVIELDPTWMSASPAFFHALLAETTARGHDVLASRLRFLRTAGSPLDPQLSARLSAAFGVPVLESYGMTEVAGVDLYAIRDRPRPREPEVAVLDMHGRRQPAGTTGEIAVRGDNVTAGYERAPCSGWIENPSGERWFLTGDEGYADSNGRLVLIGRIKEFIYRGGEKVIPCRVDAALLAHPAVEHAVAFPIPHPTLGEDLAAAVVALHGAAIDEDQLRRHAADLLPLHEVPSRILVLSELPRTESGKIPRTHLVDLLADELAACYAPPQGELECLIAEVFAEILECERPSREANFFMLGGDSLSAQRVVTRLASALGCDLSPVLMFEHQTTRSLARRLGDLDVRAAGDAGRIPVADGREATTDAGGTWYPASAAQERMWFLHQLEPGLTAYHMTSLWRLSGRLDVDALRKALGDVIERHPPLRTAFEMRDAELRQIIGPTEEFALDVEEVGDRDVAAVIDAWLDYEHREPFDLSGGRLLRARLLRITSDEYRLLVNHHHIASDGWSLSLLFRDLTALYNSRRRGAPTALPAHRVAYHDYAQWQRRALSGTRFDDLLGYWVAQLEGVPALELPTDRSRPPAPSHRGGRAAFEVGQEDLTAFENLCRGAGATLHIGLVALTAVLLGRYSRQEDFAIGVPHWGRTHPDVEDLVGLFVNTLPIRVSPRGAQTFRDFLHQVRGTSIEAYGNHALPFEHMVEAIVPQRDTSRNPLVQVMVQLVEHRPPSLDGMDGVEARPETGRDDTVRLDLEFILRRSPAGALSGTVLYARDLFSSDRIERMTAHLQTLLSAVVQNPDAPVGSLTMIPDAERAVIDAWQSGDPATTPDLSVHQLFEQQAQRTPDATALVAGGQQVSYAELDARADRLAATLIGRGVGPEKIVAVCLSRSVDWVVAQLAVFKAGGAYLPLDPSLPQARLDRILGLSGADLVLTDGGSASRLRAGTAAVLDLSAPIPGDSPAPRDRMSYRPDGLAYVLFTSGSTGTPKGVEVAHRTLSNLIGWHAAHPRLGRPARTLQFASCGFDVSLQEVFSTLCVGGCLVLIDRATQKDSRLLCQALVDYGIERAFLPYVVLEQLAVTAARFAIPGTLRDVVSAGERLELTPPLRKLFAALPDCRLHNHYGPTETHVVTTYELPARVDSWRDEASIGGPARNVEVRVVEPSGQICPIGVPGELWIGGVSLARGYLCDPGLTSAKFIDGPSGGGGAARFYRSGDLACWNTDGTLTFHGRRDEQIKVRGFRVEPGEIAAAILECRGIAQAAVVAVGDGAETLRLVAYCVPESGCPPTDLDEIRSVLGKRLPDYMIPDAVVSLDSLPLNSNGKLDRSVLPAPSFAGSGVRVLPSSEVERELSRIWAGVLGHSDFGVTDNFFLVGGNSLSAVRIGSAIEDAMGSRATVAEIFRRPTIAEQATWVTRGSGGPDAISAAAGAADGNIVTLQPHGDLPPLYSLHGNQGVANTHLASVMGFRRPLLALQGSGPETDALLEDLSLPTLADRYADQIVARTPPGTMVHLVGYSAAGWYAHAVADALLRRGATIGLFGVLDSGATVRIHRRIGVVTLPLRIGPRIGLHLRNLVSPPRGVSRLDYLRKRLKGLDRHLDSFLLHHRDLRKEVREAASNGQGDVWDPDVDFYIALHRTYRPRRLPIAVDVFAPAERLRFLARLWGFYARGGVRTHAIFSDHPDFWNPDKATELAAALTSAIEAIEAR